MDISLGQGTAGYLQPSDELTLSAVAYVEPLLSGQHGHAVGPVVLLVCVCWSSHSAIELIHETCTEAPPKAESCSEGTADVSELVA